MDCLEVGSSNNSSHRKLRGFPIEKPFCLIISYWRLFSQLYWFVYHNGFRTCPSPTTVYLIYTIGSGSLPLKNCLVRLGLFPLNSYIIIYCFKLEREWFVDDEEAVYNKLCWFSFKKLDYLIGICPSANSLRFSLNVAIDWPLTVINAECTWGIFWLSPAKD